MSCAQCPVLSAYVFNHLHTKVAEPGCTINRCAYIRLLLNAGKGHKVSKCKQSHFSIRPLQRTIVLLHRQRGHKFPVSPGLRWQRDPYRVTDSVAVSCRRHLSQLARAERPLQGDRARSLSCRTQRVPDLSQLARVERPLRGDGEIDGFGGVAEGIHKGCPYASGLPCVFSWVFSKIHVVFT